MFTSPLSFRVDFDTPHRADQDDALPVMQYVEHYCVELLETADRSALLPGTEPYRFEQNLPESLQEAAAAVAAAATTARNRPLTSSDPRQAAAMTAAAAAANAHPLSLRLEANSLSSSLLEP